MMKKILSLAVFVSVVALGCNSQSTEKQEVNDVQKEKTSTAQAAAVAGSIKLDKQKFLDQIVDYENNPQQWNYKGELPGLIDFYADWCRPCRITSPIIEELAEQYAGQIQVYKVDVQAEQELAAVFGIQSIPSFLFIPMNDKPVMSSGIASTPEATKEMFVQQIEQILLSQNIKD